MKRIVALSLVGAMLAGCQTTNPYTGEDQAAKSTKYAGMGAVAGALIGAAVDGKDGALKGAAAGGLAGAGYGSYADKQEAALRAKLQGTGVQVLRTGNDIKLIMPGSITFASSNADINTGFYPVLDSVALVLNEYKDNNVVIVGHTDSTGNEAATNQPLSNQRAQSVSTFLAMKGVAKSRMISYGVGSAEPIASNKTTDGRALNRRVELTLQPAAK